jgi:hypothetical protein
MYTTLSGSVHLPLPDSPSGWVQGRLGEIEGQTGGDRRCSVRVRVQCASGCALEGWGIVPNCLREERQTHTVSGVTIPLYNCE